MRSKILKFPATLGKSGVYLLITTATATATGLGLAFQFIPNNDNNNSRHSSLTSSHSIPALFHAFLRSSRAISTVRLSLFFFFGEIILILILFLLCIADCLHCCWLQVFFTWPAGRLWWLPSQIIWGSF